VFVVVYDFDSAYIGKTAIELTVDRWVQGNPTTLAELRGKVIYINFFQMHCPACLAHSLPLAVVWYKKYAQKGLEVIGLHTVFEDFEEQSTSNFEKFVKESSLPFRICIDKPADGQIIPITMQAYQTGGTPASVVIDKKGIIRFKRFGYYDQNSLDLLLEKLLAE